MNVIRLTPFQQRNLCDDLANITCQFKKQNGVECMYFTPYQNSMIFDGGVITITLVINGNPAEFQDKVEAFNNAHQTPNSLSKTGVMLFVGTDEKERYNNMSLDRKNGIRPYRFVNSTILYDKSNNYRQLQTKLVEVCQREGKNIFPAGNVALIEPPLGNFLIEPAEPPKNKFKKRIPKLAKLFNSNRNES